MLKEINLNEFNTLVYNTEELNENTKELNFLGDKPCIIDFYATWCGPCKAIAPILSEIANEREDINIYKINVDDDENRELSAIFGIRSIPTLLFVSNNSTKPQMVTGGLSKKQFNEIIEKVLFQNGIEDAKVIE